MRAAPRLPTQAAHSRTCLADAQDIPQGRDLISLTGSVAATRGRQVWDVIFRHIGASDVEGHLDLNGRWRAEVGDLLKSPTDAAMSRRRIEMFQYRIALAQMRRGRLRTRDRAKSLHGSPQAGGSSGVGRAARLAGQANTSARGRRDRRGPWSAQATRLHRLDAGAIATKRCAGADESGGVVASPKRSGVSADLANRPNEAMKRGSIRFRIDVDYSDL